MKEEVRLQPGTSAPPAFRIDVPLHEMLMRPGRSTLPRRNDAQPLPAPVFPQHPDGIKRERLGYHFHNGLRVKEKPGLPKALEHIRTSW
jgi:hypothetical protein